MGRPIILSNGHILVGLDEYGTVHDFYYPYVGLENLTTARNLNHKIGVWINSKFSWIDDGSWQIQLDFEEEALVSNISAKNEKLGVELKFSDFVDTHYPAFGRQIEISNCTGEKAEIRLFMHQAFQISRAGRSDTAMFIPSGNYLLDYKGWSSLLIYAQDEQGQPFDQFAVGNYGIEGKEGTFRDAEDGELSGSLVEHGGVDSVVRLKLSIPKDGSSICSYWVVAASSQFDAEAIHHVLKSKGLAGRLESTRQAFKQWLDVARPALEKIEPKYLPMAKKSLLLVKSHIDRHGGIIASCDSSIYNYGRDYYSYVWPRDGAYAVLPLIELGYKEEPRKFFEFCADTMHPAGYMMHKYQPDRAIGSTWHPQLHLSHPELPIQEDETAILLYALQRYVDVSKDLDFARLLYPSLIKPAANFMTQFIDSRTNLPHASYDLWEERFATHTYTVAVTLAGFRAAEDLAVRLGFSDDCGPWRSARNRVEESFKLLYDEQSKRFRKSLLLKPDGDLVFDNMLDSSSGYGVMLFAADLQPEMLKNTYESIESTLYNHSPSGGVPRYEHDNYFLDKQKYLGNPWVITSLWLAQYYIKKNRPEDARKIMDWVLSVATESGTLAEQVDPETKTPVGVSPLVWSHSTFLETAIMLGRD